MAGTGKKRSKEMKTELMRGDDLGGNACTPCQEKKKDYSKYQTHEAELVSSKASTESHSKVCRTQI